MSRWTFLRRGCLDCCERTEGKGGKAFVGGVQRELVSVEVVGEERERGRGEKTQAVQII